MLQNKSFDIRKLTLSLIQDLISSKNITQFLEFVRKYLRSEKGEKTHEVVEFKKIMLEILKKFLLEFPQITEQILALIIDFFLLIEYDELSNVPNLLNEIFSQLFKQNISQRDEIIN